MKVSDEQLRRYRDEGFLLLAGVFSELEIAAFKATLPDVFAQSGPACVREARSATVRSVYGSHQTHDTFRLLSHDARLVEPAMQILESEVYVYQFKINAKAAFAGDVWEWHQDYIFWRNEDGMPAPRVINVALFLDEVNEFNGPMFFIPGSQHEGMIVIAPRAPAAAVDGQPAWAANVNASLNYALDLETVQELSSRYGLVAPKGPAGSLLLFDSNVVHGSPNNISPSDRVMVISTYNSVHNAPLHPHRPEFLVSRDLEPVRPVAAGQVVV